MDILFIDPLQGLKRVADRLREHFIDKLSWMTTDSLARAGLSSGAGGLDLVFVFDSSASVGNTNFKKGITFAKTIIDEFGISTSPMGTRVAVVTFSSTAKVIFNLQTNAMANKTEAIKTLGRLIQLLIKLRCKGKYIISFNDAITVKIKWDVN